MATIVAELLGLSKNPRARYLLLSNLRTIVKEEPSKPDELLKIINYCKNCVSRFSRQHSDLVDVLLTLPWATAEQNVADAYISFLEHLLSAQPIYLRPVVEMIVGLFLPAKAIETVNADEDDDKTRPKASDDETTPAKDIQNLQFNRAHYTLHAIGQIVPSYPQVLFEAVKRQFPHRRRPAETQELFIRNLLAMLSYCPTLREDVLRLCLHRMVAMDVEISETVAGDDDDESEEESDSEASTEHTEAKVPPDPPTAGTTDQIVADMAAITLGMSENSSVVKQEDNSETKKPSETVNGDTDMAHKLDCLMCAMFQYLDYSMAYQGGTPQEARMNQAQLMALMLALFEEVVLCTHKTRYVQFLVFRMTSICPTLPSVFVKFLLEGKVLNAGQNSVTRQTAACYLSGFLARHSLVQLDTVASTLMALSDWLLRYIACHGHKCSYININVKVHGLFYAISQALLYILCFHHEHLLEHYGHGWFRGLQLAKIIESSLNPLKVVLPAVTAEFARLTYESQTVLCYTILERNERLVPINESHWLESFFPFDPYTLPLSRHHITHYRDWSGKTSPPDEEPALSMEHATSKMDTDLDVETNGYLNPPSSRVDSPVGTVDFNWEGQVPAPVELPPDNLAEFIMAFPDIVGKLVATETRAPVPIL